MLLNQANLFLSRRHEKSFTSPAHGNSRLLTFSSNSRSVLFEQIEQSNNRTNRRTEPINRGKSLNRSVQWTHWTFKALWADRGIEESNKSNKSNKSSRAIEGSSTLPSRRRQFFVIPRRRLTILTSLPLDNPFHVLFEAVNLHPGLRFACVTRMSKC